MVYEFSFSMTKTEEIRAETLVETKEERKKKKKGGYHQLKLARSRMQNNKSNFPDVDPQLQFNFHPELPSATERRMLIQFLYYVSSLYDWPDRVSCNLICIGGIGLAIGGFVANPCAFHPLESVWLI